MFYGKHVNATLRNTEKSSALQSQHTLKLLGNQ